MSKFTIKPPSHFTLVTLEGGLGGQVRVIVHDTCGQEFRLLIIEDGKLRLPRFNMEVAKKMGLKLDGNARPVIELV